ncbi:MAG: ATP-binding protein [Desulfobacterales bacterium]|nr:ATP-binding protein [Desulfobacterales bacterium]
MATLKSWYHVVVPREDLREGKPLDASEFAVHLDHVRAGTAPIDYRDPAKFFSRTYMTQNLLELAAQTVRRLSGITTETSPVFNLSTQFGGGKTHALTLLFHIAKGGMKAKDWKGVPRIFEKAHVNELNPAKVAVFVGTEFSSVSGRGDEGEPIRKTPWGELAYQIGGNSGYEIVQKHDEEFIPPAGDDLAKLFDKNQSYLLLFDELLNYISKHRNYKDLAGQFYNFMQTLTEFVRSRNNIVLAVSIPASELEMNVEDQSDFDRYKKMLDRLGKALFMSAEKEISEIIRRRLFDWTGLPQEGKKTISEYISWLKTHETHIPSWFSIDKGYEAFEASYPFHPNVLSLFERKWQSLPRFQQTRGILRLLALWVSHAYSEGYKKSSKAYLLCLGTAPLENPIFRAAVFEQMGENRLEGAVTTDIAGKSDSHALRFDYDSTGIVKKLSLHKKTGTVVFFESNGGQTVDKLCTLPEIKLNLADPDLDIGLVDTVLQNMVDGCYYLTVSGSKYRFSTQENLIKRFSDRKATIAENDIKELMNQEVNSVFSNTCSLDCILFPTMTNQVPDRPTLSFFILSPDNNYKDAQTFLLIKDIFTKYGSNPRVYRNGIIGVCAENVQGIKEEARKQLAWISIEKDAIELQFEKEVVKNIKENIHRSKRELKEQVWKAYRHIFLIKKNGDVNHIDLGLLHSSQSGNLIDFYLHRLIKDGEITEEVTPNFLVRNWPPALVQWTTKQIRDAFFSSPSFPKLKNSSSIAFTISKGVANSLLGYSQLQSGKIIKITIGKTMKPEEIEISEDVAILQAEEARKYEEPRILKQIIITSPTTKLLPNEEVQLKANGYDQFNEQFTLKNIEWSVNAGTISSKGLFKSPGEEFSIIVTAKAFDISSSLNLFVRKELKVQETEKPYQIRKKSIRWSGEVPNSKWMVFYNKVLAKQVSKSGFKVRVSFEFETEESEQEASIESIKSELNELGFNTEFEI